MNNSAQTNRINPKKHMLIKTTNVFARLHAWRRRFSKPNVLCWLGVILSFFISLAVYMGNGRAHPSGDTLGARLTPISLLSEGNFNLDEFREEVFPGKHYGMIKRGLHYYSSYPLGAALTALPVYAIAAAVRPGLYTEGMVPYYAAHYGDEKVTVAYRSEKLAAAIITALSVAALWLAVYRLAGLVPASILALAYAFGSPAMSSSSQALWTHGASCLSLAVALAILVHPPSSSRMLIIAGAALGWSIFCRPTNLLTLAVLAPWILYHWKWRSLYSALGFGIIVAATSALNIAIYDHYLGGYSGQTTMFVDFRWESLAGVLFSPSRGLLVFCSFLIPAAWGGFFLLLRNPTNWGSGCYIAALAGIALCGFWPVWGGGFSFGPRLLADIIPLLIITLAAMATQPMHRPPMKLILFGLLIALSMTVHIRGAYKGDRGWNGGYYRHQPEALWEIRNSQFLWTLIGRP